MHTDYREGSTCTFKTKKLYYKTHNENMYVQYMYMLGLYYVGLIWLILKNC